MATFQQFLKINSVLSNCENIHVNFMLEEI